MNQRATFLLLILFVTLYGLKAGGAEPDSSHPPAAEQAEASHEEEGAEHGAEHGAHEEARPPELPNLFSFVMDMLPEDSPTRNFLHTHFHNGWEVPIYSFFILGIGYLIFSRGMAGRLRNPGRYQGGIEALVEGMLDFFSDIMGKKNAREFLPLIGSLFIFIWLNNMMGLIPLGKAPTSWYTTTFALSIPVFFIVQYVGLKRNGLWGRIFHLMGSPREPVSWCLAPMMLVLEIIGELVKPVSLGLRLWGNIMGEDILIGSFAMLGVMLLHFVAGGAQIPFGFPLQLPFMFLSLLLGTIQALVFSLLVAIYILLALPHDDHGEEGEHAH